MRQQDFRRGFLDHSDPLDGSGVRVPSFCAAGSYPVERSQQVELVDQLFGTVYGRVQGGCIPNAQLQLVDFKDAKIATEPARRYLIIDTESVRKTHLRVYTTFSTYGDFLYLAIDSFMLPPMSWFGAGSMIALTLWGSMMLVTYLNLIGLVLAVIVGVFLFRTTIRSLSQGEPIMMALRRQFPRRHKLSTFDTDDIMMFFKSTVPLVLTSVQGVFEERGIPVDVLERAIQQINNVTTISTGGGALQAIGSVIGGTANHATGRGS